MFMGKTILRRKNRSKLVRFSQSKRVPNVLVTQFMDLHHRKDDKNLGNFGFHEMDSSVVWRVVLLYIILFVNFDFKYHSENVRSAN